MPFTPVRKLLLKLDLFKPSNALELGKHRRNYEDGAIIEDTPPVRARPTGAVPIVPDSSPKVALQSSDPTEFSDVVIITALSTIPFCCHEDLLTMSREQLINVALSLNAKLPAALNIDVGPARTNNFIRNSIEMVVGLRRAVPHAPKEVRSQPQKHVPEPDINRSLPTSPLAMRCRPYEVYASHGSPRLARLEEEEEDVIEVDTDRPVKKSSAAAKEQDPYHRPPIQPLEMDTSLGLTVLRKT